MILRSHHPPGPWLQVLFAWPPSALPVHYSYMRSTTFLNKNDFKYFADFHTYGVYIYIYILYIYIYIIYAHKQCIYEIHLYSQCISHMHYLYASCIDSTWHPLTYNHNGGARAPLYLYLDGCHVG